MNTIFILLSFVGLFLLARHLIALGYKSNSSNNVQFVGNKSTRSRFKFTESPHFVVFRGGSSPIYFPKHKKYKPQPFKH